MNRAQLKELAKTLHYEKSSKQIPPIRIDARLHELLIEEKKRNRLTWPQMFTEMALEWLKKR